MVQFHYDFPFLDNIEPVLRAIEGREEFGNYAREGGYHVIDYNVSFRDTFPVMSGTPEERLVAALRRECRGIAYDSQTGKILSRPLNKFFNCGQTEDSQPEHIDLSLPHFIMDKLDGSMIRTIRRPDGNIDWGTRAGVTDVSRQAHHYIQNCDINYHDFAQGWTESEFTCVFEWCTRRNRIVLDYPEDQLILTAIRSNLTGQYLSYEALQAVAKPSNIPVVGVQKSESDIRMFLSSVKAMTGIEGFVIAFQNGHRVKLKSDEYCMIHRSKDELRFEKNALRIILENRMDDILPNLIPADRDHLLEYADGLNSHINALAETIQARLEELTQKYPERRDFALAVKDEPYRAFLFHGLSGRPIRDQIVKTILSGTSSQNTVNENRHLIGVEWAPIMFFNAES